MYNSLMGYLLLLFIQTSTQLNLPPGLLQSLCYVESTHRINAIHHDDGPEDSLGLCQLHMSTARMMGFRGTRQELMKPNINIFFAGKYLKHQVNRYKSYNKAVVAYNFGSAKGLTGSKYQAKVYREWRQHSER